MNLTERRVLYSIKKNLLFASKTGWNNDEGDFKAWTKWANEMKESIIQNTEIINSILEASEIDENTLDNILP